ncbi:hypothetical protein GCM10008014_37520 [Paenibacillus silvae]|uniref:Uncharacterized protein n=1 Tax=Paenibacillus silvae TaxID=1325358 RepID=A0ABQ1ZHA6_9BACL|nr:hypothetical protein GCM10008014_37520 [Paenibacillus silvae]
MQHPFAIEEIIVTTATKDFSKRIRSFELLYELLFGKGTIFLGREANRSKRKLKQPSHNLKLNGGTE